MEEYDEIVFDFVTNNNAYGNVVCGNSTVNTASYIEHMTLSLNSGSSEVTDNWYNVLKYGLNEG